MALADELEFARPIQNKSHEAVMSVVLTGAMLAKERDRVLRPFGLTDSQFNVLMLLRYQCEEGQANQTRLGAMLLVNRANVTGLIDRMEHSGWVERVPDPRDRRAKTVRLTPEGEAILRKALKTYMSRVAQVMGKLSPAQQQALCGLLEKVRKGPRDS